MKDTQTVQYAPRLQPTDDADTAGENFGAGSIFFAVRKKVPSTDSTEVLVGHSRSGRTPVVAGPA